MSVSQFTPRVWLSQSSRFEKKYRFHNTGGGEIDKGIGEKRMVTVNDC